MSRITIISEDKLVIIDGQPKFDLNFDIDPAIHAVQWYDTYGEIEFKTDSEGKQHNEIFHNIEYFQNAIGAWSNSLPIPINTANTLTEST